MEAVLVEQQSRKTAFMVGYVDTSLYTICKNVIVRITYLNLLFKLHV